MKKAIKNRAGFCPSPPVDVLLDVAGHVEVDDVLDAGDVQPPGRHRRGNYDGSLAAFKSKTCMLRSFFMVIKTSLSFQTC